MAAHHGTSAALAGAAEMDSNSGIAAAFVDTMRDASLDAARLDAAKMCLVDWVAVCLGARQTPEAEILRRYLAQFGQPGRAPMLIGGAAPAPMAALINGTLSHCLDYDDTHIPTALHGSGPIWAGVLALGAEQGGPEEDLLKAFVCGFEIGASLGGGGIGVKLNESGWHSTAVLGRLGVAAAASYLLGLDTEATEDALGLAATQAGGLTASFGTMAKPFHAGKTAMDGVYAAQLAAAGLTASRSLLDTPKGLFGTIFQDHAIVPSLGELGTTPQILQNSLKPYAACQLTHCAIDAALLLRDRLNGGTVETITIDVNPLAVEIAGVRDAKTPTAGRFSTAFCVALVLKGYPVSPSDFVAERLNDPEIVDVAKRVSLTGDPTVSRTAARLKATLADGTTITTDVEHAFGSIGNPMGWPQVETKFLSLVEPVLGRQAAELFDVLTNFERPGSFGRYLAIVGGLGEGAVADHGARA